MSISGNETNYIYVAQLKKQPSQTSLKSVYIQSINRKVLCISDTMENCLLLLEKKYGRIDKYENEEKRNIYFVQDEIM